MFSPRHLSWEDTKLILGRMFAEKCSSRTSFFSLREVVFFFIPQPVEYGAEDSDLDAVPTLGLHHHVAAPG